MQKIVENLSKYTTFKVGGECSELYIPESLGDFVELLNKLENPFILGAGSNLIISSSGVNGPVILTKKLDEILIDGDIVTVLCGVKTAFLAQKVYDQGLSGMEFLACIPASIGGIVTMNASAHKQSVSDIIISAKVFNLKTQQVEELSKDELELDYRKSIIEENYIVLGAKFKLEKSDKEQILERMESNKSYRCERHPSMKTPNAGSIFKNPSGQVAGKLIDEAGLKGLCVGGACVSDLHANFIVNKDNATSLDILNLMFEIKLKIQDKYGYNLQPEVKYIGGNSKKEQEIWAKLNS